jgi:hypothetical protein
MEERVADDEVTPAHIVFEWLLVEAFVRVGQDSTTRGTPGTLKAQQATVTGVALSAKTYLHIPTIFGFHGVYKPLARHLGIVDDDMRLGDNGYPNHMIQALAYCALVEDQMKVRVPYALVIYAGQQVRRVEFTDARRHWLLDTIRKVELARQRMAANRNHDHRGRCAGCGVRSQCDQALL